METTGRLSFTNRLRLHFHIWTASMQLVLLQARCFMNYEALTRGLTTHFSTGIRQNMTIHAAVIYLQLQV